MKRPFVIAAAAAALLCCFTIVHAEESSFTFGPFGKVMLYREQAPPRVIAIFISGDGGWNKGVVDMARTLSRMGVVVAGVNITRYLHRLESSKEGCLYPAEDFEALSKYVQKRLAFPRYELPIVIGYSSGATLVYAVLAQAPPNTFRGGISMGFCPDLEFRKPLCRGAGLGSKHAIDAKTTVFLPDRKLSTHWTVLQGTIDQVCTAEAAQSFMLHVPDSDIVMLPHVGHGFGVERHWLPEFKKAFDRIREEKGPESTASGPLNDLPLVEIPARNETSDLFSVIISGDGGWAGLDREVGGVSRRTRGTSGRTERTPVFLDRAHTGRRFEGSCQGPEALSTRME